MCSTTPDTKAKNNNKETSMLKVLLRLLCRALFRVEVRGNSELTAPGSRLVIANHESFLDGLLIGLFLPFKATFVVHATVLKHRLFRLLLANVPHLAVDPTSPLAMKTVIRLLGAGETVVIFLEGRLTLTAVPRKIVVIDALPLLGTDKTDNVKLRQMAEQVA
jgi:acyl-[acyl-carrier-protein]-phospholipid O-acyltransferase/long-chain-fatty-acid--[acyl-carrier-protein] ligase